MADSPLRLPGGCGAAAGRLRDAGAPASGLILVSPWLDVTLADPAAQAFDSKDGMLTTAGLREHGRTYAGDAEPRNPGVSPLFGSVEGLPPVILHVGDAEMSSPTTPPGQGRSRAQPEPSSGMSSRADST